MEKPPQRIRVNTHKQYNPIPDINSETLKVEQLLFLKRFFTFPNSTKTRNGLDNLENKRAGFDEGMG